MSLFILNSSFIKLQNDTALFQDNNNTYNNDSGNHNDSNNNWIFNVKNYEDYKQISSLTNAERLKKIYVNNLISTNDNPSSRETSASSTWFKIMAFKTKAYQSQNDNLIIIEYQFITTFPALVEWISPYYQNANANWNLQTTSLVINPKSST